MAKKRVKRGKRTGKTASGAQSGGKAASVGNGEPESNPFGFLSGAQARRLAAGVKDMLADRERLAAELQKIENALAMFGISPVYLGVGKVARTTARAASGQSGPKVARDGSLKTYIAQVLTTAGMRPPEIADAVLSKGYQSKNKTLAKSIGIAVGEMVKDGQAKKLGRGSYAANPT